MKNVPQAISAAATENQETQRTPDCVTEIKVGNTILTVSGCFKHSATERKDKKRDIPVKKTGACLAELQYNTNKHFLIRL
mgnify:CR=1 FL=1